MRHRYYILGGKDDHEPVESDILSWGQWFAEDDNKRVALDNIGGVTISTVFLGIDHNWGFSNDDRPILFETMIFGERLSELHESQWRCSTWEEAEAQHKDAVLLVEAALAKH